MRLFWFILFAASLLLADEEARLLRFPAIHDNSVVFTYAGDLYMVDAGGGVARRLTSHEGYEMFARFSPDGQTLAFTGQYDGNTEVFTMPAWGGMPVRLTYTATLGRDDVADRMGPNNIVFGWTNDGKKIAFRSRMRSFNSFNGQLFLVDTQGHMPEQIPVVRGGFLSFSPDDSKMAYNRVFREFRTWKRYRGGMADDIWIFDFKTHELTNITNHPAQDIIPMWIGERIYFLSDRDKRMNLYVYDLKTKQTRQLTHYTAFDIKFPSNDSRSIVYENGGYLYRFDVQSEQAVKIPVYINNDLPPARPELKDVHKKIANYEISPDGKRALMGARGEVFTVPAKEGITYNLTETPGVHERASKWSPDGRWIAYISDATGEDEIYIRDKDGKNPPQQITSGAETYKYTIYWSPDSKKILWGDRKQRLRYVDIKSKKITDVAYSPVWEIRQYAWSPDSRYITYTMPEEKMMNRVFIYDLKSGNNVPVTKGWYSSGQPVFSHDGKYLLFVSSRDFNPIYSWTEWNHAYADMDRIYMIMLSEQTPSPFAPQNDRVAVKDSDKKKKKAKKESVKVHIDFDGIADRIVDVPVKAASYSNLAALDDRIYYIRQGRGDTQRKLMMYDLKEKKETDLGAVNGYEISADGKKMLVSAQGAYAIIKLPKSKVKLDKKLNLKGMEVWVNKKQEWQQIFNEAWRQMREFFYDPNMHGVDWQAVREKYGALVPYVKHRNDLTYILGEMVGELNIGHAYVGGGDRPMPRRIKTGLLGAQLSKDKSGYFRIDKILKGENWDKKTRSPLTEVGVDVHEGDFIIAVNGHSVKALNNIYSALQNTAGKEVTLTVNSKPSAQKARDVLVRPIADEANLYYYNWVRNNIEKVNKATNGQVGYVHIPDMGVHGLNEFAKHFYPQLRKKALIVDVRGNGGGNVSPMIIERLRREAVMIDIARNSVPQTDPTEMIFGPLIALADEFSASDGDIFTYRFKQHKLGKVVGKRTWGGVVGIRGSLPFIDGGSLNKPEFSRYSLDGKTWIMEGVGVEPDIYVDNDPYKEFMGEDQQLNRAIEEIMKELKTRAKIIPPVPPYPDKH